MVSSKQILVLALGITTSGPLTGCGDSEALASVGDVSFNEADVDAYRKAFPNQTERTALVSLIEDEQYRQAARAKGYTDDPVLKARLKSAEASALRQRLLSATTPSDAELKRYYEASRKKFERTSIEAAQIAFFLRKGAEQSESVARQDARRRAATAFAKLRGGESFESVAETLSEDRVSGVKGGRLGDLVEGKVNAELFSALDALGVGEHSEPIATPYGFVILKRLSPTKREVPPLASVEAHVRSAAQREQTSKLKKEVTEAFPAQIEERGRAVIDEKTP